MTLSVWLSLSPALARSFLSCRLSFLFTFKSGPTAAPHYLYVVSPIFLLSPLSGSLLSPQSPTPYCLFVSLHSSPSVLIPSVFPHSYLSHFSPLSLSVPHPSLPFFNHLNSFLILTIDPRVISRGCLANVLVCGYVLAVWPWRSHQAAVRPSVHGAHQDRPHAGLQWCLHAGGWSCSHVEPDSGGCLFLVFQAACFKQMSECKWRGCGCQLEFVGTWIKRKKWILILYFELPVKFVCPSMLKSAWKYCTCLWVVLFDICFLKQEHMFEKTQTYLFTLLEVSVGFMSGVTSEPQCVTSLFPKFWIRTRTHTSFPTFLHPFFGATKPPCD